MCRGSSVPPPALVSISPTPCSSQFSIAPLVTPARFLGRKWELPFQKEIHQAPRQALRREHGRTWFHQAEHPLVSPQLSRQPPMVRGGQPALEGGGPAGRDGRKSYDAQETRKSLLESGMVTCRGKHHGTLHKRKMGGHCTRAAPS